MKSVGKFEDGRQMVFVSRPEANDTFTYLVESFVHAPGAGWHISHRVASEDQLTVVQQVGEIAQALSYREPAAIPTTPGACLADGLLNRTPLEVESFQGGARIEALSWSLSFSSETSGPRDNKLHSDLFRRVDRAIDMAGAGSGIRKLRRAEVSADGRTGQEYVGLYPSDEAVILDAKLELYGNAKPQLPTIKLLMETGWPINKHPEDPRRFLSQEEALAVWDAVVKSIRPRPGAF